MKGSDHPGYIVLAESDTHKILGWVGPRIGLDVMKKRKNHCYRQQSNPNCSVIQQRNRYTDCAVLTLNVK
jgi:hypothetical protein